MLRHRRRSRPCRPVIVCVCPIFVVRSLRHVARVGCRQPPAPAAAQKPAEAKKKSKLKITDRDGSEVVAPEQPPEAANPSVAAAAAPAPALALAASKEPEVATTRPSAEEAKPTEDEQVAGANHPGRSRSFVAHICATQLLPFLCVAGGTLWRL